MARVRTRAKFSTKKKFAAITAMVLCIALLAGGVFAWTDFSQSFINRFRGGVTADVLLHDDFEPWQNKDVYVENTGDQNLIVRVKFNEFLQIGNDFIVGSDPNDKSTWEPHLFDGCALATHEYFTWFMSGNQKTYLHGTSEQGNDDWSAHTPEDPGDIGPNGQMFGRTAASAPTMTMAEWIASDRSAVCWILDTDGWAYWSQLLGKGEATNLLLDNVTLENKPDDNFYYAIDVQLNATNKTEYKKLHTDATQEAIDNIINVVAVVKVNDLTATGPASIQRGSTGTYLADIDSGNQRNNGVTWTISGNSDPSTRINPKTGVLTAGLNETGTVTVTATSKDDASKKATVGPVTFTANSVVTPKSITVVTNPAGLTTVDQGGSVQFNATVNGTSTVDVPSQAVTWELVAPAPAGVTIDANGLLNVPVTATGTVKVQARSVASNTVVSNLVSLNINVTQAPVLTVTITPASVEQAADLRPGESQQFSASVGGTTNQSVTWSVSGNTDPNTKISASGLLTIGVNEQESHTITVKATSVADGTYDSDASVYVSPVPVNVTGVNLTPAAPTVQKGGSQTFTAAVTDDHPTKTVSQAVVWSISGQQKASSINPTTGVLTVASDETATTITVTATSVADSSKSGTAAVTVPQPTVSGVTVTPVTVTLQKGGAQTFTAAVNGTNNPSQAVTWSISGQEKAGTAIDASGKLTVAADETSGTITVTATSVYDGTKKGTATVTVLQGPVLPAAGGTFTDSTGVAWRVLTTDGNGNKLIVTENVYSVGTSKAWTAYTTTYHTSNVFVKYESSSGSLRTNMNTWYSNFTSAELKAAALMPTLGYEATNTTASWSSTWDIEAAISKAGDAPTGKDGIVFPLSASEVNRYLGKTNDSHAATDTLGTARHWYLRSPGTAAGPLSCVVMNGGISYGLSTVEHGFRPAMWIKP